MINHQSLEFGKFDDWKVNALAASDAQTLQLGHAALKQILGIQILTVIHIKLSQLGAVEWFEFFLQRTVFQWTYSKAHKIYCFQVIENTFVEEWEALNLATIHGQILQFGKLNFGKLLHSYFVHVEILQVRQRWGGEFVHLFKRESFYF